ncbi:MAG: ABC transporter permease [Candidatus Odinarchaeota archaeon]
MKMKVQRVTALVIKDIKKLIRQPAVLFLMLLFPLVLTGAFGLAFGSFGNLAVETTYKLGIVDLDGTKWATFFTGNVSESEVLVNTAYQDKATAQEDLEQGKIDSYVVLPDNFGDSVDSFWQNPGDPGAWLNTTVELYVDQGSMVVSMALPPLIYQILISSMYGKTAAAPQPVQIGTPSLVDAEHFSQFDIMAPGLFAFAAIFITMIVAESFTGEQEQGLLRRIQLTPTSPTEVIAGSVIANMITAVIQVVVVLGVSILMGFKPLGGIAGIVFAFTIVSLLALCNVGFGLIAATLAKNPGSATGISFLFILPQMFFGTFVPAPESISRLVPTFYVTDALKAVLLNGASITGPVVLFDLGFVVVFSVLVIAAGVALYAKLGKD